MKKILWITNVLLPDAEEKLGFPKSVVGGWMDGMLIKLKDDKDFTIAVASIAKINDFKKFEVNGVNYFILPIFKSPSKYSSSLYKYWIEINELYKPDLVHIHGTEYAHGLAMMNCLPQLKYVVSIQGLVSVYARYYFGGMSNKTILKFITLRDLLQGTLYAKQKDFVKRGVLESNYIKKASCVIGRTEWDKTHTYFINKNIKYYFCNESLRRNFYLSSKWSLEGMEKNSVFLSQAGYPIKGLVQVIKAVSLIIDEFPSLKVYVGGNKVVKGKGLVNFLKLTAYSRYVKYLIKKLSLEECVFFLGNLQEMQMIERYKKSNVFICPSSIENSPNSVGEAQLIGVPVLSSYVGGVQDMIIHNETGLLYRFEEYEMLAYNIKQIFENPDLALRLSLSGIKSAEKRHDSFANAQRTKEIYFKGLKI